MDHSDRHITLAQIDIRIGSFLLSFKLDIIEILAYFDSLLIRFELKQLKKINLKTIKMHKYFEFAHFHINNKAISILYQKKNYCF